MSEQATTFRRIKGIVSAFVNAVVPNLDDKTTGVHKFGKDNLLPNQLLQFIAESGTATRCANKVAEYIASDGFVNEVQSGFKVSNEQTADALLQEQSIYMAVFTGCAFHISRKGGKVNSVKAIPFQCLRVKTDGNFLYNPTFGQTRYDKAQDKIYPPFKGETLPDGLLSNVAYKNGEILYIYRKSPFSSYYPVPDYYSQIEDIRTSGELAKMDLELSLNGFMPGAILTAVGHIDDTVKDDADKTEMDYIRDDFKKFTGEIKDDKGLSGRFKGLLLHAPSKEELYDLKTFDTKSILEASNTKRDVIGREVCRLFGVHPVLVGYSDAAILGNQQALANCSMELNKVVNPLQRLLTDAFNKIWPGKDWSISEYMPINYVPDKLLSDMTEDERRNKLLGLPPKETDAVGQGDKTIKALNSLSPLVANKVLDNLTADEIRSLIGLGGKTIEPTPNVPAN